MPLSQEKWKRVSTFEYGKKTWAWTSEKNVKLQTNMQRKHEMTWHHLKAKVKETRHKCMKHTITILTWDKGHWSIIYRIYFQLLSKYFLYMFTTKIPQVIPTKTWLRVIFTLRATSVVNMYIFPQFLYTYTTAGRPWKLHKLEIIYCLSIFGFDKKQCICMGLSGGFTGFIFINLVINPWCKILSRHCLSSLHIFLPELFQRRLVAIATEPLFPILLLTTVFLGLLILWFLYFLLLLWGRYFSNNEICSFSRTPKRSWKEIIFLGIAFLVWWLIEKWV